MKLIGVRGGQKLYEDEDGKAIIETEDDGQIETGVSVQAVLARGYWDDPPTDEQPDNTE